MFPFAFNTRIEDMQKTFIKHGCGGTLPVNSQFIPSRCDESAVPFFVNAK